MSISMLPITYGVKSRKLVQTSKFLSSLTALTHFYAAGQSSPHPHLWPCTLPFSQVSLRSDREILGLQINPYLVTLLHFQGQFFHELAKYTVVMYIGCLAHPWHIVGTPEVLIPFSFLLRSSSHYIYIWLSFRPAQIPPLWKFPLRSQLEVLIYLQIKKLHTEKLTSLGIQWLLSGRAQTDSNLDRLALESAFLIFNTT